MSTSFLRVLSALIPAAILASSAVAQDPPELDLNYAGAKKEMLTIGYLDKGEGPIVLFYHPGVDARYWQWAIEAVAPSYRAVAFPVDASVPPTFTFSLAAVIEGVTNGLDVEPPHLVAHSM